MNKVSILIVDDHQIVINGIKSDLSERQELVVVGEAKTGLQAIKLAESLKPDIVIMDISMPQMSGVEAVQCIKKTNPAIKVIIFTMHSDRQYVIELFKLGISAYVLKDDPMPDLLLAIDAVKGGGTYFSTGTPAILSKHIVELELKTIKKDKFQSLSRRELEVLCLLGEGQSIKEVAKKLFISPKTVESHKYNIFDKLKINNLAELTKIAIRKNLIKL
jgi:DNA-binding NarL/FixJ family response regulator